MNLLWKLREVLHLDSKVSLVPITSRFERIYIKIFIWYNSYFGKLDELYISWRNEVANSPVVDAALNDEYYNDSLYNMNPSTLDDIFPIRNTRSSPNDELFIDIYEASVKD